MIVTVIATIAVLALVCVVLLTRLAVHFLVRCTPLLHSRRCTKFQIKVSPIGDGRFRIDWRERILGVWSFWSGLPTYCGSSSINICGSFDLACALAKKLNNKEKMLHLVRAPKKQIMVLNSLTQDEATIEDIIV